MLLCNVVRQFPIDGLEVDDGRLGPYPQGSQVLDHLEEHQLPMAGKGSDAGAKLGAPPGYNLAARSVKASIIGTSAGVVSAW